MADLKNTASTNEIGVAVDVGSTSIGVCCVDMSDRTEILSFSFANPQYTFGADVITRIKYCVENESMISKMCTLVEEALYNNLQEHLGERYSHITKIVYSGNTTMLHILRKLSLDGLAQAPFKPEDIDYREERREISGIGEVTEVYLPGFSAFVGGDILSGAVYLQMGQSETYDLLVDLGTNGEMLLVNCNRGFASSTACGPVFDHVLSGARYGSESMKVIANCVKKGLVDGTGKLADAFFDKGIMIDKNFIIRQENIRNFQLAKGAIYAGIQCLMAKAGITLQDINKVYISGGMGFYMNKRDAFTLKMLPEEFSDKMVISGNTSLEGAKKILLSEREDNRLIRKEYESLRERTESFELANFENFQKIYMGSLDFI